jgi:hypothetical protein
MQTSGVWALSEKGRKANLSHDDAYNPFKVIHGGFQRDEDNYGEITTEKTTGEACPSSDDLRQLSGLLNGGSGSLRFEVMQLARGAASGGWRWYG